MSRNALFWVGLAAVLLLVAVVFGRQTSEGDPLDPESTGPLGTRGLVELIGALGGEVTNDLPDAGTGRALLLVDRLSPEQRDGVVEWVESGGTLVVTDPSSSFAPQTGRPLLSADRLESGTCTAAELGGLTLEAASFLLYPSSAAEGRCFGDATRSYWHLTGRGDGRIIALGGGLVLTNRHLDQADNAVLAAQLLLADDPSGSVVAVLYDPVLAPGSRTLTDLIPVPAKWSAWQLLVAFALFALLRGRRFGRPVAEPQPVELPGSLLIRATAELQRRAGSHEHASTTLRDELDRRLRRELRAAPELPPAELARLAAASGRVDPVDVERALGSAPASNGPMLASLVADIDRVNRAVLDRRHAGETDPSEPAPPPPGGLS